MLTSLLSRRARIATTILSLTGRIYQQTKAFGPSPLSSLSTLAISATQIPSPNHQVLSKSFTTTSASSLVSTKMSSSTTTAVEVEDPYLWLEDVESEQSLTFAKESNERCLSILGDPKSSGTNTYEKVLSILESDERIPCKF